MAVFQEEIHINRDPADVWSVVGDAGNINVWLPFITEAEMDGDYRNCQAGENGALRERILSVDDATMRTEYTILEAPMPIEFIHAGIQVTADNGGSRVVWDTTVTPDALADMFSPIYQEGLNNLKSQLES
jgi:carbon monoxide dehydrogenase subunit G